MQKPVCCSLLTALLFVLTSDTARCQPITADSYDRLVPAGKEVDAIYGDYALRNSAARAVVALSSPRRRANMTVGSVGGCLVDFAAAGHESDQLSCFYPGRRKFPFTAMDAKPSLVTVISKGTDSRPECQVRYELHKDRPVMDVITTWTNNTQSRVNLVLEDDIRADGGKENMVKSPNGTHDVFYIHDIFWQQAYAVRAEGYRIRCNGNSRESVLTYEAVSGEKPFVEPGKSFTFHRQVIVGKDQPSVLAEADRLAGISTNPCRLIVTGKTGRPVSDARVEFRNGKQLRGTVRTNPDGAAVVNLPVGTYTINAQRDGTPLFNKDAITFEVRDGENDFTLQSAKFAAGTILMKIVDDSGRPIPAKAEFVGTEGAPTPNWGPDSAEHFVKNLAYTADGTIEAPLQAGTYDITISHGPEFDAVFTKVTVTADQTTQLNTTVLKHSVKTPGWVSSDFHSHSSPSGDNTGSQLGRVLNLAAEHVEFAPCTEHNRVSTYDHHIAALGLKPFLATVSGMELTGQPLPLNHQNVFPMKHTPRTQDGGGPVTDSSPERQIERIALWDDRSEKLIQQNHPDIGWLFYDKNGDGTPDGGYSRSFPLMDVMEIHPIDRILTRERYDVRDGKRFGNNRITNWLQLLNQGFRVYGAVNTDAHYNFHGSGWLRNWIQSSTDDPAKIDHMEMVHASEQGRLIMSNGPYLEAVFSESGSEKTAVSGQDLTAKSGSVDVHVRVQCPNWFDIDTVFLLINGRQVPEYRFTRADNPDMFDDGVLKFEKKLTVKLKEDSHIIVVAGHSTEKLGSVMGPFGGNQHPAALTNPVFVDTDGQGFRPNKDTLGYPLPVKHGTEKQ